MKTKTVFRRVAPAALLAMLLGALTLASLSTPARAAAADQTLTWSSPTTDTVLLLNQPYPLSATASSGLPVSFRVQSGPAVIADGTVTATSVGTIVLVAEQPGDETGLP